jgi:hypothetical protein
MWPTATSLLKNSLILNTGLFTFWEQPFFAKEIALNKNKYILQRKSVNGELMRLEHCLQNFVKS